MAGIATTASLTIEPNAVYTVQMIDSSKFKPLYNIFWVVSIVMIMMFVLLEVITLLLPWFFGDFWTRTRSLNLDYTVLYFWIGCFVQIALYAFVLLYLQPRESFGSALISKPQNQRAKQRTTDRTRTSTVLLLVYAILMIAGAIVINLLLFIWNGDYTDSLGNVSAIGNPFTGTNANYDYKYDRMALVLSYIVIILELIIVITMITGRGLINSLERFPMSQNKFYARIVFDADSGEPILKLIDANDSFQQKSLLDERNVIAGSNIQSESLNVIPSQPLTSNSSVPMLPTTQYDHPSSGGYYTLSPTSSNLYQPQQAPPSGLTSRNVRQNSSNDEAETLLNDIFASSSSSLMIGNSSSTTVANTSILPRKQGGWLD